MGLRHAYQATGANDPGKEVSRDRWNADHEITDFLEFPEIAAPAAPAADVVRLFGKHMAGHALPAFRSETGRALALQPSFSDCRVRMWSAAGNGLTDSNYGGVASSTGTATAANWASTNFRTRMRWREWLVTTAATSAVAGFRGGAAQFTIGGGAAGQGGFSLSMTVMPATGISNGSHRLFAGMRNSTAAPTDVNPSTLTNICGLGYDAGDTNLQFMHNDGSGTATKIDLGSSFPKPSSDRSKAYQLLLYAPPGTTQSLSYLVIDLETGAEASGTVTTDLPSTTTALNDYAYISVGGVSSVVGLAIGFSVVETDN